MLDTNNEGITISILSQAAPELKVLTENPALENRLHIEALYEYAAQEQAEEVEELRRDEQLIIPKDLDYNSNSLCLSCEEREKLLRIQPQTVW